MRSSAARRSWGRRVARTWAASDPRGPHDCPCLTSPGPWRAGGARAGGRAAAGTGSGCAWPGCCPAWAGRFGAGPWARPGPPALSGRPNTQMVLLCSLIKKGLDHYIHYLDTGLREELAGEVGVKWSRHREDREVLGGYSPMLARHVGMEAVAGLGHGAAEDAAVARAERVLVLHVGAQGVGRPVDLAALGAGPGVRGPHPHHLQLAAHIDGVHVTQHSSY